jgi:hypothetical protein
MVITKCHNVLEKSPNHVLCNNSYQAHFLRSGFISPTPYPKLEDDPLSAVRYCLLNIFLSLLPYLEALFSNINLRTRHAVTKMDPLSMEDVIDGTCSRNVGGDKCI